MCSKSSPLITFQEVNIKGADRTERMCRLVCTFVIGYNKDRFSRIEVHMDLWLNDEYKINTIISYYNHIKIN